MNKAARIDCNACGLQAEIFGVRAASNSHKDVAPKNLRRATGAIGHYGHATAALLHTDAHRIQAHLDTFPDKHVAHCLRYILILPLDEMRGALDHRHTAAKPAVHLRKLQSDVTSPNDDQMLRQKIHLHHAGVGEIGNIS